jgi:hypothetical protein
MPNDSSERNCLVDNRFHHAAFVGLMLVSDGFNRHSKAADAD